MFGLFLTPVFAEIVQRDGGSGRRLSWLLGFALVGPRRVAVWRKGFAAQ